MVEIPDLSEDGWAELVERLTLYADSKLRKLSWRGVPYRDGGQVPGAVCASDLAAESIESFFDGSRQWNKETEPDFAGFLMNVIDSKVSHLVESAENRITRRIDTSNRDGDPAYYLKGSERRPDDIIADSEIRERTRASVISALEGDELAASLFECYEADMTKPREIAELLGIEVSEVHNARKRLARAADKAFEKLGRSRK